LRTIAAAGTGPPHGLFSHNQQAILLTNVNDKEVVIFSNTVLEHVELMNNGNHAVWEEAAQEIDCFPRTKKTFDPEADTAMPLPAHLPEASTVPQLDSSSRNDDGMPHPEELLEPLRLRPTVFTALRPYDVARCAEKEWSPPSWLHIEYVPHDEYDLPPGIRIPTVETTTYVQVVINEQDNIAPEQIPVLKALVARHPHLFNDGMGCVREPIED
jgi:hypothetical protein